MPDSNAMTEWSWVDCLRVTNDELVKKQIISEEVSERMARLHEVGEVSTECRRQLVTALYVELEAQLKAFYQCRETSLAVTNLQQSWLWRNESSRLWADAENTPPHAPDCVAGSKCGEPSNCPPPEVT